MIEVQMRSDKKRNERRFHVLADREDENWNDRRNDNN